MSATRTIKMEDLQGQLEATEVEWDYIRTSLTGRDFNDRFEVVEDGDETGEREELRLRFVHDGNIQYVIRAERFEIPQTELYRNSHIEGVSFDNQEVCLLLRATAIHNGYESTAFHLLKDFPQVRDMGIIYQ